VVVGGHASIITTAEAPGLKEIVEQSGRIVGKKVFTVTGDDQGTIGDIYFDERSGDVLGYEVSGGFIGDAATGTSYLPAEDITTIGHDVIYVQPEVADSLDQQVGGVQGALQDAGQKLGETKDGLAAKAGGARDAASRNGGDASGEALIGKRTGSDVETDSGAVIVPQGRRVRPEDVEAARAAGKLPALTSAVAVGAAQEAGAEAKDALGSAGDSAASLWDQFTAKLSEMTDATGKRLDEQKTKGRLADIADAIGRPVTKVILDREDNVILNMGDIITHQAVQRAHEAGGLDSLLQSVYKANVEFAKEEMRAPAEVQAEATVEKASGGAAVVEELEDKVETAERERKREDERNRVEAETQREQRKAQRVERKAERDTEAQKRTTVGR
jgi:sporulation protein YlmC with PRC-barrel domain